MMFSRIAKISLLSLPIALLACGGDDDDDKIVNSNAVSTGQIYATYQIISDGGNEVYAEAQLTRGVPPVDSEGPETFVRLIDGDELWLSKDEGLGNVDLSEDLFGDLAELNDKHVRFDNSELPKEVYSFLFERIIINDFGTWYSATMPQSEDNTYVFSLLREKRSRSTESTVTIPPEYEIISPRSNETYSRSQDDILIEWNNTDTQSSVEIEINVSCSRNSRYSYSEVLDVDIGSYTIPAGDLDMPELEGACSATLNLRKVHIGQFDNRYIGGTVNGYQIRRVVFRSNT